MSPTSSDSSVLGWFLATSGKHISRFSSNHRSLGHAHASMVVTLASLDYNFSSNHRSLGHAHASMVVTLASLDYKYSSECKHTPDPPNCIKSGKENK